MLKLNRTFIVNVVVVFAALALGTLVLMRAAAPAQPATPPAPALVIKALPAS